MFKFASKAFEKVSKAFTKKLKHARMIKKYDKSFDENTFGDLAQTIYIDAHTCLMRFLAIIYFKDNSFKILIYFF